MSDEATMKRQVGRALAHFYEVWPKPRNAETFERQVIGADPTVIVPAAELWVDHNKFAPTPAEFREYVWKLHRAKHPLEQLPVTLDEDMLAEAERVRSTRERLDKRARFIFRYCTTGSTAELSEIWALVWEMCEDEVQRAAFREGNTGRKQIIAAIRAHRGGRRAVGYKALPAKVRRQLLLNPGPPTTEVG